MHVLIRKVGHLLQLARMSVDFFDDAFDVVLAAIEL